MNNCIVWGCESPQIETDYLCVDHNAEAVANRRTDFSNGPF